MSGFDLGLPQDPQSAYADEMRRLREGAKARDDAFMASFGAAARSNPDIAAEAQQIAKRIGQPEDAVESNIEVAREVAMQRTLRDRNLEVTSPNVFRSLQNNRFRRVAHDDLDNLISVEGTFDWIKRNFESGEATNERGFIGMRKILGLEDTSDDERLIEMQARGGEDPGFIAGSLNLAGQMKGTLLPSVAVGGGAAGLAALGGPVSAGGAFTFGSGATMFTLSSAYAAGNRYLDMIEAGIDPKAAKLAAGASGIAEGLLETVAGKAFLAPAKAAFAKVAGGAVAKGLAQQTAAQAFLTFAKDYATATGAEVATEMAQEAVGITAQEMARASANPELPGIRFGEAVSRIGEEGWQAFEGMALLGLPLPVARGVVDMRSAAKTHRASQFYEELSKNTEASKLAERAPDAFAAYVARTADGTKADTTYVDAKEFANALKQSDVTRDDLRETLPAVEAQIDEALASGGDIRMPTADYAAKLARTDLGKSLVPHMRLDPEARSAAELQQFLPETKAMAEQAEALMAEQEASTKAFRDSAHEVEDAMLERIRQTGALQDKEARASATYYRDMILTLAKATGMMPAEFDKRYGLRVVEARTVQRGEGALSQGENVDTPEFRAWFGESKVVDEAGKPLVVYHGTNASFQEFGGGNRSSKLDAGFLGSGFYFSSRSDVADYYADRHGGAKAQVYPAHVALKNPFMWGRKTQGIRALLMRGDELPGGLTKAVLDRAGVSTMEDPSVEYSSVDEEALADALRSELKERGFDGVIAETNNGSIEVVAFDPTQIKSVNNRGTFDPNDPNILRQEDRAFFDPETMTAALAEKADVSSFLHEASHYYLAILSRLAAQPEAAPVVTGQLQAILDWFGVKDIATWNAMTGEQQRKHHEAFAYSFEVYLSEGKAPTRELKSVFDKFAAWIRRIYRSIQEQLNAQYRKDFGEDLPAMTGEIRQVMDRMVASADEIAASKAVHPEARFESAEQAGMGPDEWAAYLEMQQERDDAATADLTAKRIRRMEWLGNARSKFLKERQKAHDAARAKVRAEVATEVRSEPIYRAHHWLRKGILLNDDGTTPQGERDPNHKLSREDVVAIVGEKEADGIKNLLRAGDGLSPDAVAETFGFRSGEAMVRDLVAMRPFGEVVDERTDQRMVAEFDDLVPGTKAHKLAIAEAMHNEASSDLLAVELRHLTKAQQPVRILKAQAKEAAEKALAGRPLRNIRVHEFEAAEHRAARAAMAALKKGDMPAAIEAKRNELLQHEMAKAAVRVEREVESAIEGWKKFQGKDEKISKQRDVDIVNVGRDLLSMHNVLPKAAHTFLFQKNDPEKFAEYAPILDQWRVIAKDMRSMPLRDFRALREMTDWLWHRAKRSRTIEADGRAVLREDAIEEMLSSIGSNMGPPKVPTTTSPADDDARRANRWSGMRSKLIRVEHWARKMDGGKAGPVTRYLFRPLRDRFDAYMADRERLLSKVRDGVMALELSDAKIEATELIGSPVFDGTKALLGAIQHSGNESNLRKLLVGYGWVQEYQLDDGTKTFDPTPWFKFLERMFSEGKITKAHMDYVQSVWDMNERELKPLAQRVNREVAGVYFEEIEARSLQTPFGTYRGGYMPATPDPDHARNADLAARHDADAIGSMEQGFRESMPGTARGFTISRTQATRPLQLDIRMQASHLDQVLRFIHLQPAVRDVLSLLRDQRFASFIGQYDATAINGMLMPWLKDVALNQMTKRSSVPAMDKFLSALRRNTGLAFMFSSLRNAAQQITGIVNAGIYVKGRHLRAGLFRLWGDRDGASKFVAENSKFMNNRINGQIGQIQDDIEFALDPTWIGSVNRWTNKHGYWAQRFVQNQVDLVTWLGAYDQAMARSNAEIGEARAHKLAVQEADAAVRMSQGSMTTIDSAAYERSSALVRLLTQFSSYFNVVLNQIIGAKPGKERSIVAAQSLVIPTMIAAAIAAVASGGKEFDDEDDDGVTDEVAWWLFSTQVKAAGGMVPMVGPGIARLLTSEGRFGDRLTPAPAWAAVEALTNSVSNLRGENPKLGGRQIRDAFYLIAIATGIPVNAVGKSFGYLRDLSTGDVQPTGTYDLVRGIASGQASRK